MAAAAVAGARGGGGGGGYVRAIEGGDNAGTMLEMHGQRPLANDEIVTLVGKFQDAHTHEHMRRAAKKISDLYEAGELCDVVVHTREKNFGCHLEVLAAHSTLFQQANDKQRQYLEIMMDDDTSADHVKKILDYFYEGKFSCDYSNAYSLYRAAEKLQVPQLVKLCRAFLKRLLVPRNLIYVLEAAEQNKVTDLNGIAYEKYRFSFYEIVQDEQFLEWDVGKLLRFLNDDEMIVQTEFDVFKAGFRWIDGTKPDRLKFLKEIMLCVRFGLMSKEELVACAKYDISINHNGEVREMISDANWNLTMTEKHRKWSQYTLPAARPKTDDNPEVAV